MITPLELMKAFLEVQKLENNMANPFTSISSVDRLHLQQTKDKFNKDYEEYHMGMINRTVVGP